MDHINWLTVVISSSLSAVISALTSFIIYKSQKRERYREILIPEKLKDYRIINETFARLFAKLRVKDTENIDQLIADFYDAMDVAKTHSLFMPMTFFAKCHLDAAKMIEEVGNLRENENKNYGEIIRKLQEACLDQMLAINKEFSGGLLAVTPKSITTEILRFEEDLKSIEEQIKVLRTKN